MPTLTPRFPLALALATVAAPAAVHAQCDPQGIPTPVPSVVTRFSAFTTLGSDVIAVGDFIQSDGTVAGVNVLRWSLGDGLWRPMATTGLSGPADGVALAVTALPTGDLIVGGEFLSVYGAQSAIISTRHITRWDAATGAFTNIGTGLSGGAGTSVRALVTVPSVGVVVGGSFGIANGVLANNIALLNTATNTFSALGQGVSGTVNALTLVNNDVIVGGSFTQAGGSAAAARLARLNPTTGAWSAFGLPSGGQVNALVTLPNGDVVAGGDFTSIGGIPANRLARWSAATNTWSQIGGGLNGSVLALGLTVDGDLLVGGNFDLVPGTSTSVRFAGRFRLATSTWTTLDADSEVRAILGLANGEVLAGGLFGSLGGNAANRVGRFTFTNAPSFATLPGPQASTSGSLVAFTAVPSAGIRITSTQWSLETAPNSGMYSSLNTGPIAGSGATAVVSLPGPLPLIPGPTTLTIVGADSSLNNRRVRVNITAPCGTSASTPPVLLTASGTGGGGSPGCYPNCDGSTSEPVLNALDFACFLQRYRAGCP